VLERCDCAERCDIPDSWETAEMHETPEPAEAADPMEERRLVRPLMDRKAISALHVESFLSFSPCVSSSYLCAYGEEQTMLYRFPYESATNPLTD